jgi:hypothetical protein
MLQYAQELLSHAVPGADAGEVIHRALQALIPRLEKQKFAGTTKPRPAGCPRSNGDPRYIPAEVKRAVWERDQGRCTFVAANGRRCGARQFLEFDHRDPVARGGQATVSGVRLLCSAHNQLEAERFFGAGFMAEKREAARRSAGSEATAGHERALEPGG